MRASTFGGMSEADARTYLALAVQHLLVEKGMTHAELAAAIMAKPSDLSRRLSGEVPLENRDIARLASGLGVTPQALVQRAVRLGSESTQAGTAARLGLRPPVGPPAHDVTWWQALIDEAKRSGTPPGDSPPE